MCGRYTLTADGETVRTAYGLPDAPFDYRPRYNIAPQQDVLVVAAGKQGRRAGIMRWGLVPGWADSPADGARMINARSETVHERAAFREAFERRRCLIPADGFYEWRNTGSGKIPMRITRSGEPFAFAGLWEKWQRGDQPPLYTCTILTTTPAPAIAAIHDRMPVMLRPEQYDLWLQPDADTAALQSLLQPYEGADLDAYVVSTLVNKVENDGPECIAPAAPEVAEQTSLF
ncbi:MAG TPA: SOS response-associated peptidase [Longimicrobiales bacterium]|nr:SOS response-associated peptidase [Longimicrobiales bacterium]